MVDRSVATWLTPSATPERLVPMRGSVGTSLTIEGPNRNLAIVKAGRDQGEQVIKIAKLFDASGQRVYKILADFDASLPRSHYSAPVGHRWFMAIDAATCLGAGWWRFSCGVEFRSPRPICDWSSPCRPSRNRPCRRFRRWSYLWWLLPPSFQACDRRSK